MRKKLPLLVVTALVAASLLAACGDATNTAAPAATTARATTAAATTAAAVTTAAATVAGTLASTTAAATTAAGAATTAAATTAAGATTAAVATTAAGATTAAVATTAAGTATTAAVAGGASGVDANGIEPYQAYAPLAANFPKGGNLNSVSLAKQLAADLHPYPQSVAYTSSWTDVAEYLFGSTLVYYNVNTLNWAYGAAEKATISADGKTYAFTLRSGLKFSDGSPITADDFAYAVEQASKKDAANPDNEFVSIDDLEKIGSYKAEGNTVTCTLKDAAPKNLALGYCGNRYPIKKSLWSQYPFYDNKANPEILKPTVTSGPYKLKEFKLDERIVIEVNPNYYRGVANLETITYLPSAQPTNAYESVKAGQNQYAGNISASQVADAKGNANVNYFEWAAVNGTTRVIEFNMTRAPFTDKAMRQAFAYAVDRDALLKAADAGLGVVTDSFVNPADKNFYNPSATKYPFDLNKSRSVLKDAGYTGGTTSEPLKDKSGKEVEFTIVFPTSSNPRKLQATYLQQQLKQLGIKVNVDGQEFNAYVAKTNAKDYDVALGAWGGGTPADPSGSKGQFLNEAKGGTQNKKGYSNPRIDELFTLGDKELDNTKRAEYYKEIQKIISDDLPTYYLYTLSSYTVTTKSVQGAKPPLTSDLDNGEAMSRWAVAK